MIRRWLIPGAGNRLGIGWLFSLALIPGILAGSILFHEIYQNERAQLDLGALQTARALSLVVDREMAGIKGKLQILATSPSLQAGDLRAFHRQAQDVLATEDLASAIVLTDGAGQQILNTLSSFGAELPKSGHPELLQRTFRTGQAVVSDLYMGAVAKRPFVALEVPVWRDGKVVYALDMGISAERMSRLLVVQNLPNGWVAALLDTQGVVAARNLNAAKTVGQKATPDLLEQMTKGAEGTKASRNLEGIPTFAAFSRSSSSGWTVVVAMTRNVLYAKLYWPLFLAGLTILAFLSGGAILAWIFSRHVREALRTLGVATEAATSGDLNALAPLSGPLEISRLAEQFNRMQKARKDAEAQLRLSASVFSAASEGIVIADRNSCIIAVNQAYTALTGYTRDEVIGKNPRTLQSGKHGPDFYRTMWQTMKDTGRWQGDLWNSRKDGTLYAVHMTLSVVKDEAGLISHYIALFSDVTDAKHQQEKIERLAYYDPLTHLPNRRLLSDRILQSLSLAARNNSLVAVCYLDLDGFKPVNDTYGHEAGDQILLEVAGRLGRVVRSHDTVSRLGGDEFVLLLTQLNSYSEGEAILVRALQAIGEPFAITTVATGLTKPHAARISASIGVAFYPDDGTDPDVLLRHSDQAMYKAKQAGRNQVKRFRSEHDAFTR